LIWPAGLLICAEFSVDPRSGCTTRPPGSRQGSQFTL